MGVFTHKLPWTHRNYLCPECLERTRASLVTAVRCWSVKSLREHVEWLQGREASLCYTAGEWKGITYGHMLRLVSAELLRRTGEVVA